MVDVFISYKQEERDAVRIVAAALSELRLKVWFDTQLRAGDSFDDEIATALNAAKAVLVCWTPAAIKSDWVRAEATEGYRTGRLAACFLQPAHLVPPFNLIHTENLAAWAGQTDDAAWRNLLRRIGELTDRPGLATYYDVMRAGASLQDMEAWANANGADQLVDTVWARVAQLRGEDVNQRFAREKEEARHAEELRNAQAVRSRQLMRDRGLRDPVQERRRYLRLGGALAATVLVVLGAIAYFQDDQERDRALRDGVSDMKGAREFLSSNRWHPISRAGREKFERLDAQAWLKAASDGTSKALLEYIREAEGKPEGPNLANARRMLDRAEQVAGVQRSLARLQYYRGQVNGRYDLATKNAISQFQYNYLLPVSGTIDDALERKLEEALVRWVRPRLDELNRKSDDLVKDSDYVRFAEWLNVDAAIIKAIPKVSAVIKDSFRGPDKRMLATFTGGLFLRLTQDRFADAIPRNAIGGTFGGYAVLEKAYELDWEAALKATSWGRFQILGMHHERYGFETVGEFLRFISVSEANQLEGAFGFIRTDERLAQALRKHDWTFFSRMFYGMQPRYAAELAAAYQEAREQAATARDPPAPPHAFSPEASMVPPNR